MRRFKDLTEAGWAGPLGALMVLAALAFATLEEGFSLRSGPIEMTLEVSTDQGLQLRFAEARP